MFSRVFFYIKDKKAVLFLCVIYFLYANFVVADAIKKNHNIYNNKKKISINKSNSSLLVSNESFNSINDKKIIALIDKVETTMKQKNFAKMNTTNNAQKTQSQSGFYAGMVGDKRSGKGLNLNLIVEERNKKGEWLLVIDGKGVEKKEILHTSLQLNPTRFVIDVKTNVLKNKMVNFTYQMPKDLRLRYGSHPYGYRIVVDLPEKTKIDKQVISTDQLSFKLLNKEMINRAYAIPYNSGHFENFMGLKTLSNGTIFRKIMIEHAKPYTIAIDAGHGGIDSGARSSRGLNEKKITLIYAKSLQKALKKKGFHVIMTRDTDKTVSLGNRVQIAQKEKADIFISLHADAHNDKNVSGTTVYRLSHLEEGHPDWEKFYKSGVLPEKYEKYKEDKSILDILVGLTHQSLSEKSSIIVDNILLSFKKNGICKNCRHGERSLAVLRGLKMISILIEIGYITNEKEEKKMMLASNIEKFTNELASVVDATFNQ